MRPTVSHQRSSDVAHLGVLLGDRTLSRIIALATSTVFEDRSLQKTFWDVDETTIDSGFQGHLYTRPEDTFVVGVKSNDDAVPEMVLKAIEANHEIWRHFTGIELSSAADRIVLASDKTSPVSLPANVAANIRWHTGSLLSAGIEQYRNTGKAFLAFVLNNYVAGMLDPSRQDTQLAELARNTSLLMDKNIAMDALLANSVECAKTYPVNEGANLHFVLSSIPPGGKYVFKPAGGAAGIGVFSNNNSGASLDSIISHIENLKHNGQLPRRFQIQEFVSGAPYGITAFFGENETFRILEVHQQTNNETGRFVGGRWSPSIQAEQMEFAEMICRKLAAMKNPSFSGPIGLDVIGDKIIEVNPRLTASAPIAHLLRDQDQFSARIGENFQLAQIDLNTNLPISYEFINDGSLRRLIEHVWKKYRALVLPQGLDPFGSSRFIFINDDAEGAAQQEFLRQTNK